MLVAVKAQTDVIFSKKQQDKLILDEKISS